MRREAVAGAAGGGRFVQVGLGDSILRWPGTESNRRRQPFQGCALPTELPGRERILILPDRLSPVRSHPTKPWTTIQCRDFVWGRLKPRGALVQTEAQLRPPPAVPHSPSRVRSEMLGASSGNL